MELAAAENLARELMQRYGIGDWTFRFDRARRRFGSCCHVRKTITLSAYLTHLNDDEEVCDTILHEIAHALTPGDGHGPRWRAVCRQIGAKPERTFHEGAVRIPKTGLRIGCGRCNWWANRHRVTWQIQICR